MDGHRGGRRTTADPALTPRVRIGGTPRRTLRALAAGLCLLTGLSLGEVATPAGADPTATADALAPGEFYYYVHAFLDAKATSGSYKCRFDSTQADEPNFGCNGTLSTATTTVPFNHGDGTMRGISRGDGTSTYTLFTPGAELSGIGRTTSVNHHRGARDEIELDAVTGQGTLASGHTTLTTRTTPGVAAGERGGKLRLGIANSASGSDGFDSVWDLRGWVIGTTTPHASGPGPVEGQYWYYIHLLVVMDRSPHSKICVYDVTTVRDVGCSGTYATPAGSMTTPPFQDGDSTVRMGAPPAGAWNVDFYRSGAVLKGTAVLHQYDTMDPFFAPGGYVGAGLDGITGEGNLASGYTHFTLEADPDIPVGELGGRLRTDFRNLEDGTGQHHPGQVWKASIEVQGWVLATDGRGEAPPTGPTPTNTVAPTASSTSPSSSPSATAAAVPVAVAPRFTG